MLHLHHREVLHNNKLTLQEAALLQSLNHDSNIVQFLGACISKESQEACLVLEYMEVSLQTSCASWKGPHADPVASFCAA